MMKKDRNQFVDIMRGIAMLLVVLGHTMTGCTVDSQQSLLFNIVWSLQMPLFILISGYVTKYSCTIWNVKGLFKYIKRRTVAYMLPWFVWSFLIRGIVFGQKGFLDIKSLIWNMDSGYWFLATIWSISMIFGVASYVAELVGKDNNLKKQMTLLIVYILGMVVLASIGILLGMSFFAIKLTLYYMPFYYLGYLYGQYDARILDCEKGKRIVEFVIASSFIIWLFVILRISIYEMPDNGFAIIMRAGISLAGCIAISGLIKGLFTNKSDFFRGGLSWIGAHSLEIYCTHYLLLCLVKTKNSYHICSLMGKNLILINYVMTVILTILVVKVINSNRCFAFLLMGKKK